ncbi:molybdopterin molybdotransferase MoeA [Alisedimentitalea sp. MJ-SS2]|uniref:molybdopterin molybdotransferase MoeA n=1 Tax=Aliisedimentitalea sp. MJ-SS2 TaxID=3049795 RepID=UPI0029088412|nr:gephyrin-like molybdotransferase Glp [Alisedimentitalea sp. MJ-SS2]MDU8929347.1 molybdopterin molybdotransferase MoeA [Alisedimentitalea sp. MJ-SS2]
MSDKLKDQEAAADPAPELIVLERAIALAQKQVSPIPDGENISLDNALGRVSGARVLAPEAMPFFDNSAMDGFALCVADLADTDTLPVAGTVAAGAAAGELAPGAATRIYTGAPLPLGADAVVKSEDCTDMGDTVRVHARPKPDANIRRKGSDQPKGASLLNPGQVIAPRHVGLLAANGVTDLKVTRTPRVGIFSTGDELTGGPHAQGAIFDANRPMLMALCRAAGVDVTDLGVLPDDLEATTQAFERLGDQFDLVFTSGAVSIGGRDHVRAALMAAGGTLDGWRVAIKPGKPIAFGRIGKTVLTCLPGNPFAAFVGFHLFARPQIAVLSGATPESFAMRRAKAGFDWTRRPGRAEVFPVCVADHDEQGTPILERLGNSVSATLFPMVEADGLAIVSASSATVAPGDSLRWQRFTGAVENASKST